MQIVRILCNNLVVNFFECLLSVYTLKYASFKEIKNNGKEYLSINIFLVRLFCKNSTVSYFIRHSFCSSLKFFEC